MKKMITIGSVKIGHGYKPATIAEAAVEHLGSVKVAMRMVDSAKSAGADFIKFQMHLPEKEMLPNMIKFWGGSLDEILENYNLSIDDHRLLIDYCKEVGIEYLCSPFCPDAVDVLDNLGVKGFKTGSGELSNLPLMKRIADTGKPVIVSTGMSTMSEIEETVNFFKKANSDLIITNCTSIYPAPYNSINLNLIPIYRKKFGVIVGHSDHTPDIWTSLGAISLGASIIEKHFTLNRCLKGPDHAVSLEPDEFGMMVSAIDKIYMALGDKKIIHKQEEEVKSWANHSVVSLVDISKGGVINKNNISVKRPGGGIPAKYMESLFQKKVSRDVKKNSILNWEDVDK